MTEEKTDKPTGDAPVEETSRIFVGFAIIGGLGAAMVYLGALTGIVGAGLFIFSFFQAVSVGELFRIAMEVGRWGTWLLPISLVGALASGLHIHKNPKGKWKLCAAVALSLDAVHVLVCLCMWYVLY